MHFLSHFSGSVETEITGSVHPKYSLKTNTDTNQPHQTNMYHFSYFKEKDKLTNLTFLLILFCFGNCTFKVKTDESSVKKIVTITEYLVLNNNFDKLDTVHQQKQIQKFDGNNNKLEEMDYFTISETFVSGLIYKYDKGNNLIEEYLLVTHNEISSKFTFEYYKNTGTQYVIENHNSKIKRGKNYYDPNKNLVREITYDNEGKIMSDFYYKYNSKNQKIERGGTLSNKKIQSNYLSYDSIGNLIEQKCIDTNGIVASVSQFIYTEFDASGYWKIRQRIIDGQLHSVAFQKVELK